MLMLRSYIEGTRFMVRADYHSSNWISSYAYATGRLIRFCLGLSESAFDAVRRTGLKHQVANALSRLPTIGADTQPIEDD